MKPALCLSLFVVLLSPAVASVDESAAVRRADQRRIQATITSNATELGDLLSDDLHYAYSDGRVQTKAQLIAALANHQLNYISVDPEDVKYQSIARGAAVLSGRARLVVEAKGQRVAFTLHFLAVWRDEAGTWRLVAYQSSQLSPPTATMGK
jgi:hypothetical protein